MRVLVVAVVTALSCSPASQTQPPGTQGDDQPSRQPPLDGTGADQATSTDTGIGIDGGKTAETNGDADAIDLGEIGSTGPCTAPVGQLDVSSLGEAWNTNDVASCSAGRLVISSNHTKIPSDRIDFLSPNGQPEKTEYFSDTDSLQIGQDVKGCAVFVLALSTKNQLNLTRVDLTAPNSNTLQLANSPGSPVEVVAGPEGGVYWRAWQSDIPQEVIGRAQVGATGVLESKWTKAFAASPFPIPMPLVPFDGVIAVVSAKADTEELIRLDQEGNAMWSMPVGKQGARSALGACPA